MEQSSSEVRELVRKGTCPMLGLPGGLKKQSRTPAAGRLDRDPGDETGMQRGDVTPGMIKSLSDWIRSGGQIHKNGKFWVSSPGPPLTGS